MPQIELSAGTIAYGDTHPGATGLPTFVLLHGPTIDGSVWRHVTARLGDRARCLTPTLPLGAHVEPMRPDADLSIRGVALLVEEFLERLGLTDVTLVANDRGGPQLLITERRTEQIGRVALTACEAFDNCPPGLPGRTLRAAAYVPGGLWLLTRLSGLRVLRRAAGGWGWMSRRPVPDEVMDAWFRPSREDRRVRRDLRRYLRSVPARRVLLEWAERMRGYEAPVLVVWAVEDRLMPREHGARLAGLFPAGRLVELEDTYTLIPEDAPGELAEVLAGFAGVGRG